MGCCCGSLMIAAQISACIDLEKFFNGKIKEKWSIRGFSEYKVFKSERNFTEVFSPEERKQYKIEFGKKQVSFENILQTYFMMGIQKYLKTHKEKKYTELNLGQCMYLGKELARDFTAHIIEIKRDIMMYDPDVFISQDSKPLDGEAFNAFKTKVLESTEVKELLDVTSQEPHIIKIIEIRMIRKILEKLPSYNIDIAINAVYQKMFEGIESSNIKKNSSQFNNAAYSN